MKTQRIKLVSIAILLALFLPYGHAQEGRLLTLDELINEKVYTSLEEALIEPESVYILDLSGQHLEFIPSEIEKMTNLQSLILRNNYLEDFDIDLSKNKLLQYLVLSENQFSTIPQKIGTLSNLSGLYLIRNELLSLPESIGALTNLTELSLTQNQLMTLPESIGNLSNLKKLYLSGNQLISLPECIGSLSNLEHLDVSRNQLTLLPECIASIRNLKGLNLSYNQLTTLPKNLGNLVNLPVLNMSGNHLTKLPESICNLSNLESLYIDENQLTTLPENLGNLNKLEALFLSENKLAILPESIGNLSSLKYLDISVNQLTYLPESIVHLNEISQLYLNQNKITALPKVFWINEFTIDYLDITTLPSIDGINAISKEYLRVYKICKSNIVFKERLDKLTDSINVKIEELEVIDDQLHQKEDSLETLKHSVLESSGELEIKKNELKTVEEEMNRLGTTNKALLLIILIIVVASIGFIILLKKLHNKNSLLKISYKKLEEQQLELIQKEKDSFIANMVEGFAHDLRTPFSNIGLNLETLQAYSGLNKQFDNTIDTINFLQKQINEQEELHTELMESFNPILEWVNAFQIVSRTQLEKELSEFSLNGLFNELHQLNKMKLNTNNILLEIKSEDEVYITSVKGLSSQIFQNILANAIEHGFKGHVQSDKKIKVTIEKELDNTVITIRNNGRLISKEDISKIFDRYHSSVAHGFRGLGLYSAKRNVESLNGSIEVSSDEENGVVFTVTLPNNAPGIPEV